jgi:catechol 2,3-dioxygenase-like lactoylglutathione lyase family enzyme
MATGEWLADQFEEHREREPMKIKLTSVHVDNQEKALRFYTEVLGFVKKDEEESEGMPLASRHRDHVTHILRRGRDGDCD